MKGKTTFNRAAFPRWKAAFLFFPPLPAAAGRRGFSSGAANALPFLLFAVLGFFLSCSGHYPKINDLRYSIILLQGPRESVTQESLSLALDVSDEDGIEDLEGVALVNDREELFWKIGRGQWEWKTRGGSRWLVCAGLLSKPGSTFPRETYRVVVTDLAGYRAERSFSITGELPRVVFPALQRKGDTLVLTPGSGSTLLVLTSATGAVLGTFPLRPGENSLQTILAAPALRSQAKEAFLYSRRVDREEPIWIKGPYQASELLFSR